MLTAQVLQILPVQPLTTSPKRYYVIDLIAQYYCAFDLTMPAQWVGCDVCGPALLPVAVVSSAGR